MGGRALIAYGYDTVRLPTDAMRPIGEAVAHALEGRLVPWIRNKPDHGDADVVIPASVARSFGDDGLSRAVSSAIGMRTVHVRADVRDPVMAIGAETPMGWFQIDLITAPDELVGFSTGYLSWGDLGTLMGQVARQMGLLFGSEGLRLPVLVPNAMRACVTLTYDFDAALRFMGWDPAAHEAGFADEAAIVEFVASGRYFDPDVFLFERLSSDGRRRSRRRPMRPRFLESVAGRQARFHWPAVREEAFQRPFVERAIAHFEAGEALQGLLERLTASVSGDTAFSGRSVSAATGVTGRPLQHLVNEMVRMKGGPEAFDTWRTTASAEEVAALATAALPAFLPHIKKDQADAD